VAVQDSNSKAASPSTSYVQSLQRASGDHGQDARETELYKLALRGASDRS
jgi:hypothetical protein